MNTSPPSFYLFSIASVAPVVVIDERLFTAEENGSNAEGYMKFYNSSYSLRESMRADALEKIFRRHNQQYISRLEESFYREALKEVKKSDEDLKKNKALNFILNNVFPHLRGRVDATGSSAVKIRAREKKEYSEEKADPYIESLIKKISSERCDARFFYADENPEPDYLPTSILGKSLMGTNVLIKDQNLYKLIRTIRPDGWNVSLSANGVAYRTSNEISLKGLEELFRFNFEKDLKIQFLKEKLAKDTEWRRIQSNVKSLINAQEYTEKDFGFRRRSSSEYDVFLNVPEFVLKDVDRVYGWNDSYGQDRRSGESYYYFDGTKVCVRVSCSERGIDVQYTPFTTTAYGHPFTGLYGRREYGDEVSDKSICMGNYSVSRLTRLDKGHSVAKLLVDAKNVLMYGYQPGVTPRVHLSEFSSKKMSLSEISRRGLKVTNTAVEPREDTQVYRRRRIGYGR